MKTFLIQLSILVKKRKNTTMPPNPNVLTIHGIKTVVDVQNTPFNTPITDYFFSHFFLTQTREKSREKSREKTREKTREKIREKIREKTREKTREKLKCTNLHKRRFNIDNEFY